MGYQNDISYLQSKIKNKSTEVMLFTEIIHSCNETIHRHLQKSFRR